MSRARHSLAMQVGALRHIIPIAERGNLLAPDVLDALKDLLKTVEVVERHQNLTRAAIRLEQKHPEIAVVMTAFAGLDIADFRYDECDASEAAE